MEKYTCPHCNKLFASGGSDNSVIVCPHCNGVVLLPSNDFRTGDSIGGFEIISLLGKGGMGNVYLSKQISMQRLVALKTISSTIVKDPKTKEQFLKEVQLSGRLNHPNIITAIDAGEDKGTFYLAVNYIDGEDYERRLNREFAISEKEALQISLTIADSLKYAWEKHHLLHKDIKPGNLIKDKRGEVFLMDLGIAQKIGRYSESNKDMILGSPFYMSPEQARNDEAMDWRTDLYSLGATLYHMIVGVPPYDAQDVNKILVKHVEDPFPEPLSRNPNSKTSYHVVVLIKKMMAKKPEDRFSSWDEFKEAVKKTQLLLDSPKTTNLRKTNSTGRIPQFQPKTQAVSVAASQKSSPSVAGKGNITHRKSDTHVQLMNYGLILVTSLVVAFIARSCIITSSAGKSLRYADEYYTKYPYNFEEINRLYLIAFQKSKGTKYETEATGKYNVAMAAEENYKRDSALFDSRLKDAAKFYGAKDYQNAMNILDELKKTEDPVKRQYALGMIVQVENAMKAEGLK